MDVSPPTATTFDAGFLTFAGQALDLMQDEVLWTDDSGRFVYVNRSTCRALDYSREELLNMTVSDICPDMTAHAWSEHWQALKIAGHMVLEARQRSRSGQYSLVEIATTYVQHEGREYSCAFGRDITERTRIERDLTETKQQLETIFDTMQAGIILVDRSGFITFANQRMAEMFGCTLDELIGSSYPDHIYPDQHNLGDEQMRRLIAGEIDLVHHERHFIRRDGGDFWGHLSGRRQVDDQGNLVSLVGVIADITEIKATQQAIQESEERYRTIIETMQDVYYRADPEGRLVMVSPSGAEMSGYDSVAQILGSNIRETFYYDPEERDAFLHNLKLKGKISGYELTLKHRDGSPLPVAASSHLIVAPDGTFLGVEGVYHDMRPFRTAMDRLKASEDKFAQAFSSAPVMMTISDIDTGHYLEVNDRFCEVLGFSREELIGRTSADLGCLSTAERQRLFTIFVRDGRLRNMEVTVVARDGMQVFCLVSAERITYEGMDRVLSISLDITEHRRGEEERRHLEKQLLHTQKLESLGVLAGGIAHDFNNILMAVSGNADLALKRINIESPVVENLQNIRQAAARAADLARQMLAYSGKGKFVVENIDLNSLLEEMLPMLRVSISKKAKMRFNLHYPLPSIEADATQIHQVIMNLVINASEAIGAQDGVIDIATGSMTCDPAALTDVWLNGDLVAGTYVYLEIADTGCGMDADTLTRIFDPFFTTKFTGRGLGMAAVMGIVRGHNGAITTHSEVDKGTTFRILFPLSDKPATAAGDPPPEGDWHGSGTVLLVDDEEAVRAVGTEMLKELGFTAITAADGNEAVKVYTATPDITLVILDLTMPHLDGEQCFRELRHLNPDVKVIMASGYNEQEITQKFAGKGLNGFLHKPYLLATLEEVIKSITG